MLPSDETREAALRLLARLLAEKQDSLSCEAAGVQMHVHVSVPNPDADLTPCERDLLSLLREQDGRPRPWAWLSAELASRERLHGDSTIRRALARLVKIGRITSRRSSPRGYRIV